MKCLTNTEIDNVYVAAFLLSPIGAIGLAIGIPTIVFGSITGLPTLGLGFVAMAVGIVITTLSGKLLTSLA